MRRALLMLTGALVALAGCATEEAGSETAAIYSERVCEPHQTLIECEGEVGSSLTVSNDGVEIIMNDHAEPGFLIAAENIYVGTAPAPTLPSGELDTDAFPYKHDYAGAMPADTEHRFEFADLGVACGDTLQIAFHVIAAKLDASGAIIGHKQGKAVFAYEICCEQIPVDAGTPAPEPDAGTPAPEPDAGMDHPDEGCTLTQGYWRNHPQQWPVGSLEIAGETYDSAEILTIFETPVRGDASISLAHQLFAAMLNVEAGATEPDAIDDAIDFIGRNRSMDADGDGRLPYGLSPGTEAHRTATALADRLAAFNEGRSGPGHCDDD